MTRGRRVLAVLALLGAFSAFGAVRTPDESAAFVRRWSAAGRRLTLAKGRAVSRVVPHRVGAGGRELHEVRFEQGGFAVVDASDPAGGVIAFSDSGEVVESAENPLWTMLRRHAELLAAAEPVPRGGGVTTAAVSDLRVAPLLRTSWGQGNVGSRPCFNYHTPDNDVCGCVATAVSQILRHHAWPTGEVASVTRTCRVGGVATGLTTFGGTFGWKLMPDAPSASSSDEALEAIGRLTYDCGVLFRSEYSRSGTSAYPFNVLRPLKETLGYGSASYLEPETGDVGEEPVRNAVLASLDARCPVLVSVCTRSGDIYANGHAVVADGYGFSDGVGFVHLNLGWNGVDNAWYALPDIAPASSASAPFNLVDSFVYNIFPTNTGAVVSGRVVADGEPCPAVTVSAYSLGGRKLAQTASDGHGVYALFVAEQTSCRIVAVRGTSAVTNAVKTGVTRSLIVADDGSSASYQDWRGVTSSPNVWGCDFDFVTGRRLFVDAAAGSDSTGTGAEDRPFATISHAIARAGSDGVVRVAPGRYRECVVAPSAQVSVISTGGASATVIDAEGRDCCYDGSANTRSLLKGFTLVNGAVRGGACRGTLEDCIISNCTSLASGGGASGATLTGSVICWNAAERGGGASNSRLERCTVYGNCAFRSGSGVDASCSCRDSIVWCNFNASTYLTDNWERAYASRTTMTNCCTEPAGFLDLGGSFTNDPRCVALLSDDWRLRVGSPCLGAGTDGVNVGADQGGGVEGFVITTEVVGRGTVNPGTAIVGEGGDASFAIAGDGLHPFLRFETNGVFATDGNTFVWRGVTADGSLTAVFGSGEIRVDASAAEDGDGTAERPFREIQRAVDAAADGDVVSVAPGRYGPVVNGYVSGLSIVATEGPGVTFIDGAYAARCFDDYVDARLEGFSLVNGCAPRRESGGAAYGGCLAGCVISNSTAATGGGAAYGTCIDCLIAGNAATEAGGGTVSCGLVNCTVVGNRSTAGAGGIYAGDVTCNCIVSGNRTEMPEYGSDVYCPGARPFRCLVGGDAGFADPARGDYRLAADSPCVDAGENGVVLRETDLAGRARISGAAVDLGCYEYDRPAAFGADRLVVSEAEQELALAVFARGGWRIDAVAGWLAAEGLRGTGPTNVTVTVARNGSGLPRRAELTLRSDVSGVTDVLEVVQAAGTPRGGRHYGIFVGLDEYAGNVVPEREWLKGAVAGVTALKDRCLAGGLWHPDTVSVLADAAADRASVRAALADLAARAAAGDVVLFAFSGYGGGTATDPRDFRFQLFDAVYRADEFAADLSAFGPGVKFVVIAESDSAAGLFAGGRFASDGVAVLAATDVGEASWDAVGGGEFMTALVDGWRTAGADADGDGRLSFWELFGYASVRAVGHPDLGLLYRASPRAFNGRLLAETLAEVTDPRWPAVTDDASCGEALVARGYSAAIADAVKSAGQYAAFAKWTETAGVTAAEQNAAPAPLLSAALWADGLLRPAADEIRIDAFELTGGVARLSVKLPGYDVRQLDAPLLRSALGVASGPTPDGLAPVGETVTVTPRETSVELELPVPEDVPRRFFRGLVR